MQRLNSQVGAEPLLERQSIECCLYLLGSDRQAFANRLSLDDLSEHRATRNRHAATGRLERGPPHDVPLQSTVELHSWSTARQRRLTHRAWRLQRTGIAWRFEVIHERFRIPGHHC